MLRTCLHSFVAFACCTVAARAAEPTPYKVAPPDILRVEVDGIPAGRQPVTGEHLVRPDGTLSLGEYGTLEVAGQLVAEIQKSVKRQLAARLPNAVDLDVDVSVVAHNSQSCFVIVDGGESGSNIHQMALTGNETVASALLDSEGTAKLALAGRVWVARRSKVLDVDWKAITQDGERATNYQLEAGDRIYVDARPAEAGQR